jgi:hypothetical protein
MSQGAESWATNTFRFADEIIGAEEVLSVAASFRVMSTISGILRMVNPVPRIFQLEHLNETYTDIQRLRTVLAMSRN